MLTRWSLLLLGLVALAGTAAACQGLSPGDQLDVPGAICTLGFLVASPDGLFFTTAGHCIQNDEPAGSPGLGEWGKGVFHYLDPETGGQSDGSPGNDFALIRIDPKFYGELNPKMCGWEGPTGLYDDTAGEGGGVMWYGHGVLLGDIIPKREGTALRTAADSFHWIGTGVPGDSGGAVIAADGRALGVLTHLTVGVGGTNGGTSLARGFRLAEVEGFTGLRLVLAGEDPVQVLRALQSAPPATPEEEPPTASPGNPAPTSPPQQGAPSNTTRPTPTPAPAPASQPEGAPLAPAATREEGEPTKRTPFAPAWLLSLAVGAAMLLAARKK